MFFIKNAAIHSDCQTLLFAARGRIIQPIALPDRSVRRRGRLCRPAGAMVIGNRNARSVRWRRSGALQRVTRCAIVFYVANRSRVGWIDNAHLTKCGLNAGNRTCPQGRVASPCYLANRLEAERQADGIMRDYPELTVDELRDAASHRAVCQN